MPLRLNLIRIVWVEENRKLPGPLWRDENEEMRLPCLAEGIAEETSEICTAIGSVSDLCASKLI